MKKKSTFELEEDFDIQNWSKEDIKELVTELELKTNESYGDYYDEYYKD